MGIQIKRMKELRAQKGMTQAILAQKMNISRATVAMWESGKNEPNADALKQLAQLLGCTVDYLLGSDAAQSDEDDLWTLREEMRRDPNRRALMQLARSGSAQDVRQAMALIDALRATSPDFYDGDDPA